VVDDGHVVLNGARYRLAHDELVPRGKRAWTRTLRRADVSDPGVIKTARWNLSGPMGASREGADGYLGVDYCDNLDHRYDQLLTSTAKRNIVGLTAIGVAAQYGVPVSDVLKSSWTQGAGDSDGSAFDELDDGIASGTPDDATTYWTTSSGTGSSANLTCGITSLTDPGTDVGFRARWRVRHTNASETVHFVLFQGSSAILNKYATLDAANTWQTVEVGLKETTSANITDFTDLRMALHRINGSSGTLDCSAMELELPATDSGDAITIDEDRGSLFVQRGSYSTQVNAPDMSQVDISETSLGTRITDSIPEWQGSGFVAFGGSQPVQERTGVTAAGATYAALSPAVYSHRLVVSSDRVWVVEAGATDTNKLRYALDALTSGNLSNAFQVADPGTTVTGLYASHEYMLVGHTRGLNSFTASGKPSRFMPNLRDLPSTANAAAGDDGFEGWTYVATELGLFAVNIEGKVVNPVGPGEGLAGQGFEGPIDGYPTAVRYFGDSLYVAYLTTDGDSYVFRGTFGRATGGSGRPEWFAFRKLSGVECHAIGATAGRTNPTLILAEDSDISYYTLGRRGRDIADSNYEFSSDGGTWYGTTMMRAAGRLMNVRAARFLTENCDATNTWQLAISLDGGAYIDVGTSVATSGLQTARPVSAGVPLTTASGSMLKPRLTQVADDEASPPQIRGFLDVTYDERPETVEEHTLMVVLGDGDFSAETEDEALAALLERSGAVAQTPIAMTLPGETETTYGFVVDISGRMDLDAHGTQAVAVTVLGWDVA
jgi:hypothetical protein